jgi:hypothetical protein
MDIEASENELAEFDEQHQEYLVLRELKLVDIVKLAHLISPAEWSGLAIPPKKSIWVTPRFTALKNEAIFGRIKCQHSHRALIDHAALISLADLLAFLATAGPEWEWLQRFARRWQGYQSGSEVVSAIPPASDGSISKIPAERRAPKLDRAIKAIEFLWPEGEFDLATAEERNDKIDSWCKMNGLESPHERTIDRALQLLRRKRTRSVD